MSEFSQYLLAASPVVIYTCKAGDDYGGTYISENIADLLGYNPAEFLNDPCFWKAHVHPEDSSRVLTELGTLSKDGHLVCEYRFQAKNGQYHWMRDEARLVRNPKTGSDEIIGSWLDITDRKALEEKYHRIADLTSDYVHYCTRTGTDPFRIQWIDGAVASITGYRVEEIFEMGCWLSVVHPDDRQVVASYFFSLLPGDRKEVEYRIVTKDQGVRWVLEKSRCEAGPSAGVLVLFGAVTDITGRKDSEEITQSLSHDLEQLAMELIAANQELEAFSYSLSHDLRNYLTRISLASEALQSLEGARLQGESKYLLQMVFNTCQVMDGLIATMLTLARISRMELQFKEIDLSALAGRISGELALAELDRNLHFAITPGLHVTGDAHLLQVALENLLGNACKYTKGKAEARISLSADQRDGRLVFAVADNGTGFDMAEAGKLFQPFQRLANARTFSGFGVGLTTVQRIIQRHGGEIWAEAVPGEGATFYFTLPGITP